MLKSLFVSMSRYVPVRQQKDGAGARREYLPRRPGDGLNTAENRAGVPAQTRLLRPLPLIGILIRVVCFVPVCLDAPIRHLRLFIPKCLQDPVILRGM